MEEKRELQGDIVMKRWGKRYEYAETAADIFLFLNKSIFLGMEGYMYKERGQIYPIITPALLADDLKETDSELLKTMCFLADIPDDNVAKFDLTRLMNITKREFNDALNESNLTADELNEMIETADDLMKDLKEEEDAVDHEERINPSRQDELKPQIEMFGAVIKALETKQRLYKKIVKGLD